jgi:glycosyltransferase involved in cell wall biosynthesis
LEVKINYPKISIVMPAYNAEKTIEKSIRSILDQTYSDFELIILDDCSNDNTYIIAKEFEIDQRVKVLQNNPNLGFNGGGNYTKALSLGSGQFHAIFHADDIYYSNILEEQLKLFNDNPDVGAVLTNGIWIDEQDEFIKNAPTPDEFKSKDVVKLDFLKSIKLLLKSYNFFIAPSALIRMSVVKNQVKYFDYINYRASGDLDMWLRILEISPILILNKPLIKVRQSDSRWSSKVKIGRIEKEDFFYVMDHYLEKYGSKLFLSEKDKNNYLTLQTIDKIRSNYSKYKRKDFDIVLFKACFSLIGTISKFNIFNFRFLKWYFFNILLAALVLINILFKKNVFDNK